MLASGIEPDEPVIELPMPKPPSIKSSSQAQANDHALAHIETDLHAQGKYGHIASAGDSQDMAPDDSLLRAPQPMRDVNQLLSSATAESAISAQQTPGTPSPALSDEDKVSPDAEFKARMDAVDPAAIETFQALIRADREEGATAEGQTSVDPLAIWREGDTPQLVMSREPSDAHSAGSNPAAAIATQQRSLAQQLASRLAQSEAALGQPSFERERKVHESKEAGFTDDQQAAMAAVGENESSYMSAEEVQAQLAALSGLSQATEAVRPGPERIGAYGQIDPEIFRVMARAGFPLPSDMQAILLNGPEAQSAPLSKPQLEGTEDSDEGADDAPVTGYGGGHGVRKTILDPAAAAAKLAKDAQKAQAYKELSDAVNAMRHAEDYSSDAFANTLALLKLNPEYYTIWNYRRNIFLKGLFPACVKDAQAKQDLMASELKLLQSILQDHPKVYCLWVHRKWCLAQCPWPDWQRELMLVTRMLEQDARNFHVWEYRRYVVGQLEQAEERSLAEREFEYTTAAISHNFSNFSAWHNRTKLIPTLLLEAGDTADVREGRRAQLLRDELTLLKDALFTDPDDQSVWLYHKWLLNPESGPAEQFPLAPQDSAARTALLQQELEMIDALLEEEPGHVWCLDARCVYNLALLQTVTEATQRVRLAEELERDVGLLQGGGHHPQQRYVALLNKARQVSGVKLCTEPAQEEDLEIIIYNDVKRALGTSLRAREIIHCGGQAIVLATSDAGATRVILPMMEEQSRKLDLQQTLGVFDAALSVLQQRDRHADKIKVEQLLGVVKADRISYVSCGRERLT